MGKRGEAMPGVTESYKVPAELVLGKRITDRVPQRDQTRQRGELEEILRRFQTQPGVVLADEVGMGKTFVALATAYTIAINSPRGPVVALVPSNLVDKWIQDLNTFCELYVDNRKPVQRDMVTKKDLRAPSAFRFGVARHSVDLLKLLDDDRRERCHLIFLAHGAMSRRQSDKWIRLALIGEALRRHGRGKASRLIQVKNQIHRFLARLLWAVGEERAHEWGEDLWQRLLRTDPRTWKNIYNDAVRDEQRRLTDDPVPKAVARALERIDVRSLAEALEDMPVRARGGEVRVNERIDYARRALRDIESALWKVLLREARWRSPLLVMDEAHHLKNPGTLLARQLQSPDSDQDLRTGDGAMANAFDRMLFLTATPFQLGHHELVHVMRRFGDVRWDSSQLGEPTEFQRRLSDLNRYLNESQRTATLFQKSWSRLRPDDCDGALEPWWKTLLQAQPDTLTSRQRAVLDAYTAAKQSRTAAEGAIRPWIVRHNKGMYWPGTDITRRQRINGAAISGLDPSGGLAVPPDQLLPFFLAARSSVNAGQDLLGEALCSSYEAFRFTRQNRDSAKDEQDESPLPFVDQSHAAWYLGEFDRALEQTSGATHPKMHATVRRVVDLWESGEKVLVFAFYRHSCRALRVHISQEIDRRITQRAQQQLRAAGQESGARAVERLVERIQKRFFDDVDAPGRRAMDAALGEILQTHTERLGIVGMTSEDRELITDVMRRFLRASTTLVRCFPLAELEQSSPANAVAAALSQPDRSGTSWRDKFDTFVEFLTDRCSTAERQHYLDATQRIHTGGIRVDDEDEDSDSQKSTITLPNVQVATGKTKRDARSRLMRAFNTPFFPDILVCSEVMGEGVDLQRFCRHVIHHDLAWNPSTIEQRTGRIDRLGCKAEGRHPIIVFLPYLAGTADERQYRVMSDREQWFRVVMGQDEVARLITPESAGAFLLPESISDSLSFNLGI